MKDVLNQLASLRKFRRELSSKINYNKESNFLRYIRICPEMKNSLEAEV